MEARWIIVPGPRVQMGRPRLTNTFCTRSKHLPRAPPDGDLLPGPSRKFRAILHLHLTFFRTPPPRTLGVLAPTHTGRPGALSILRHRALPLSAHLNALGHGRHHVPELVRSVGIQPTHSIPDPAPEGLLPLPPTRLRRRHPAIEQRPRILDGVEIRGIRGKLVAGGAHSGVRSLRRRAVQGSLPIMEHTLRRAAELAPRVCGRPAPSMEPKRTATARQIFSRTS